MYKNTYTVIASELYSTSFGITAALQRTKQAVITQIQSHSTINM